MIPTSCAICGSKNNFDILYPANFKMANFNPSVFSARRLPDKIHYQIVKCRKCGLVRSNPILETEKLDKLYKTSQFTYGEEAENLTATYFQALEKVLKYLGKDAKILEIGCGNGFLLKYLFDNGFKNVFGVEPSKEAVKIAPKEIKKNIKVDVFKKGLEKPQSFDFIFFFQTFDHIPNPNDFLKEVGKALKKGGYVLTFNHSVESLQAKILKDKSPIIDIEHTYLYSPATIRKIFEKNGFKVIDIYSPKNFISLKHLIWLLPLPKTIKLSIIESAVLKKLLSHNLKIALGNLCLIAKND